MKWLGSHRSGYTIVETMIFLAVSSALFVSAMALVGGRAAKTEFNTGVREMQSNIQDIMNDVGTGYYSSRGDFSCNISGGSLNITATASPLGTNTACIFIGRVLHFEPTGQPDIINVYTLIGKRVAANGRAVSSLDEADPIVLDSADSSLTLPNGITVGKVSYGSASVAGSFAVTSSFAGAASASGGLTGTQDIGLYPITGTSLGQSAASMKDEIKNNIQTITPNPGNGIVICLISGGTNEHAILTVGGPNRQLATDVIIEAGVTCP